MNWNVTQNGYGLLKKFGLLLSVMVFYIASFGQADFTARMTQDFAAYHQQVLQEKIFAHTDKDFYTAGEIIWFKLYAVEGTSHKPLDISKAAYVEVLDGSGKPVLQAAVALNEGTGDGSLMLPFSLSSGNYWFRVYTAWMKNFSPDYFFQKPIAIVNTLKRPDWPNLEKATGYDVQFFPEGGNLVTGLQSNVAFKVTDQYGKGAGCRGVLIADGKDTVARFQTFKFGMGRFGFTPASGHTYKALLQFENGVAVTKDLPAAYPQGYVMSLTDKDSTQLKVSITAANLPDAYVYLFVHTGQQIHGVLKKATASGKAEFVLDKKDLGEGISHVTLFNEDRQPLCERLYFKRPTQQLQISIKTDQETYAIRNKVLLDVSAQTGTQNVPSDLSLSVFLLDSLQTASPDGIQSYLWLTSDLNGTVESPDYYFDEKNKDSDEALENLLLTQGWRRFKWEDVTATNKLSFSTPPEYEGPTITGTVVYKATGAAASNIRTYLSVPGDRFVLATAKSDSTGQVQFVLNKNFGSKEILIQTADSTCRVDLLNPFSERFTARPLPEFHLSQAWVAALVARSINIQAQHAFFREQQQQLYAPGLGDTTAFYGVPDKRYWLDEYTRFTTMEEVLREYITEVRVRKNADQFQYQVQNIPYKTFFDNSPLVLLDGVPVLDINRFMAFDPLKIRKVEVVARKYFFGDLTADGIVSYATYQHDLAGFEMPSNALALDYNGLQLKREFYTPLYETNLQKESRLPDFRTLLTWQPDVKTGTNGTTRLHFYTSDLPGTYAIVIQGMDSTGKAGKTMYTFTVQK